MLRSLLRACEGDDGAAGRLLGVRPRTIRRWLAGEIGIAASTYEVLRLWLWAERQGMPLRSVAYRHEGAIAEARGLQHQPGQGWLEVGRGPSAQLAPEAHVHALLQMQRRLGGGPRLNPDTVASR